MLLQLWFLVVAVSQIPHISSSTSSTTSPLLHKKSTPPVVYTAEKSRKEPFPSYSTPTIATNLGELYDEIKPDGSNREPENTGFVEPIDFNSFLSDVNYKGKNSANLSPLFASESNAKDNFADFFKSSPGKGRGSFIEPNFGGLASSASDQKSQKHNGNNRPEEEYGFVDPNVQFRSLFDSSETADGFKPEDFLGSKDNSAGVDPSKGSQTRTFPQFTYTGRNGQNGQNGQNDRDREDEYESQPNNKYRSSYRQVDSRDDRDRGDNGDDGGRPVDPYDDSSYYQGENDDSPSAPPNPDPRRYQNNNGYSHRSGQSSNHNNGKDNNGQRHSPTVQESSHTPQASGSKKSEGKGKCKKIEKDVDYSEDYAQYVDPEPDYDPSTYGQNQRYRRQAGRGRQQQKSNKRPMTCYVCEDEQGRYAERCSYDSKGDPSNKDGNFYQSSSTSFGDNRRQPGGRGGNGGSDRYRRNPSLSASKSVAASLPTSVPTTTVASASTVQSVQVAKTTENSSDRDKRQSPGGSNRGQNTYQDDYGDSSERGAGQGQNRERDNFDDYSGEEYDGQGSQGSQGSQRGPSRGHPRGPPSGYEGPERSSSHRDDDYGSPSTTRGPPGPGNNPRNNNNDDENYGFGPPQRGSGSSRGRDFNFGPPSDFGRDASASNNNNNEGFNFDFSIPREFDPDAQIGTSNTQNRPVFSGNNNGNDFGGFGNFDVGYDDYVKKYFPGAFGGGGSGGGGGDIGGHSTPGPSPASTSYRPHHGHSSSSPGPPPGRHSPNKEHTQQSHNYAPAPYYENDDQPRGHFDKIMGSFGQRDRSGCQRYEKDGMTCYLCRDSRGMKKEDCMMAQGDPNGRNTRVAYHESTEYSSPPASVLPVPHSATATTASTKVVKVKSPVIAESKVDEKKKSPLDYDFDY